jgi:hypothetical protein
MTFPGPSRIATIRAAESDLRFDEIIIKHMIHG